MPNPAAAGDFQGLATRSHRISTVVVAAHAAFAFLACLRRIGDPDYWTHLALGRAFVAAGSLSIGEPFLLVQATTPSPEGLAAGLLSSSGWPFQLALLGVRQVGGDEAVSVAIAACGALAVALAALPLLRETRVPRLGVATAFVATAIYAARFRFSPRPEAAAAGLLVSALLLALSWQGRPRLPVLGGIAGLLLIWKPLHVSWTLGAALVGIALAVRPRIDFWKRQRRPVLVAAVVVAAGAAYGVARFALFVLDGLRGGGLLEGVTEMRPTWEFPSIGAPFLVVALSGALLAWGGREGRLVRLAVWALAAALGTLVVRNVGLASLAMIPGAMQGLSTWPGRPVGRSGAGWVLSGALACLLALTALIVRDRDYPLGLGVDWRHFPRDAAEFVRATPLGRPVFNSWGWGGYLDWAWNGEPRTFLDGRLANRSAMHDHDLVLAGNPEEVLERWGFGTVLLQPVFHNSGRLVPAVRWFMSHPEWILVHASEALVFTRTSLPPPREAVDARKAWAVVLDAAELASDQNDVAPHAEFTRALALLQLGRFDEGREAFERGARNSPGVAVQYAPLGAILRAASRP